jgi:hypothetical protein
MVLVQKKQTTSLAELLRLPGVMHAFERIRWFAGGPRTLRLQAIIQTPWAGD